MTWRQRDVGFATNAALEQAAAGLWLPPAEQRRLQPLLEAASLCAGATNDLWSLHRDGDTNLVAAILRRPVAAADDPHVVLAAAEEGAALAVEYRRRFEQAAEGLEREEGGGGDAQRFAMGAFVGALRRWLDGIQAVVANDPSGRYVSPHAALGLLRESALEDR